MTPRRAGILSLIVIIIAIAAGWTLRRSRQVAAPSAPAPAATAVSSAPAAPVAPITTERILPAGCDPLPAAPPLPAALDVKSPTVEGVVEALDASLGDAHKAFLRCFPDEEDLVARVHAGFGRWLRNTLHLWSDTPLTAALRTLGAATPDEMSTVIIRAYGRALKQAPLDVADAVSRTKAMADRGNAQ